MVYELKESRVIVPKILARGYGVGLSDWGAVWCGGVKVGQHSVSPVLDFVMNGRGVAPFFAAHGGLVDSFKFRVEAFVHSLDSEFVLLVALVVWFMRTGGGDLVKSLGHEADDLVAF